MTKHNEKFYRWLNAYFDDTLTDEQRSRFEALIDRDATVREHVTIQRDIENSMRRLFAPNEKVPTPGDRPMQTSYASATGKSVGQPPFEATESSSMPSMSDRQSSGGRVFRRVLALAAMILLAAGTWVGWQVWSASERMAAFYESSKLSNFREDWVCDDEQEFQTTFWYRLDAGVTLAEAKLPDGTAMMGLKYSHDPKDQAVYLMGKVDGQGVIVRVIKKADARFDYVFTKGLAGFRKEGDHLAMIEITPLNEPHFLDAMSETELPEAWKKETKLPGSLPH